jgi:hypothetical protein
MPYKVRRPGFILAMIFMIVTLACGGTTQVATQTPITPRPTSTTAPSYTPLPTYTPKPSPTRLPTITPEPTITSVYHLEPTDVITNTALVNCVPSAASGYNTCIDDTGSIKVDVPDTWNDVNGSTWTYNGMDIGVALSAAPSLEDFHNSYNSEGLFFGASKTYARYVGSIELLDIYTPAYREACSLVGRYDYDDGVYIGSYDKYVNCGGNGGYDAYILVAKEKVDQLSKLILIEIQVFPGDFSTVKQIWGTFLLFF